MKTHTPSHTQILPSQQFVIKPMLRWLVLSLLAVIAPLLHASVSTPTITAILPPNGSTAGGTVATIVGTGFTNALGVTIGGQAVTSFTVVNDSMVNVTTAAFTAGLTEVVVANISGDSTGGEDLYTYGATPVPAGATWLEQAGAGSRAWFSIASSADGSKLAAVDSSPTGSIWTSTDSGVTWTEQVGAGSHDWISITSSSDGAKLAAVGPDGIWTSTDSGATWTEQTNAGVRNWRAIASSANGSNLAAVVTGANVWTSTDSGGAWTERVISSGDLAWNSIASSADGSKLAAAGPDGIWTSTDSGATWTEQTNAGVLSWRAITSSADGSKLAAVVAGGNIWTSADSGVTWTEQVISTSDLAWNSIASSADGSNLAATVNGGNIWTSTDAGVTWTEQTNAGSQLWSSIASSADGSKLTAGIDGGNMWTSPNLGPVITSPTSFTITTTGATLGGNVTSINGSAIIERGVVYSVTSINDNPFIGGNQVTKQTTTGTTGVFTIPITGLTIGTEYSFKAYATNSNGTSYTSPVSTFTTLALPPTLASPPTASNVTTTTVTLGSNVTSDNGAAITERGVVYSLSSTNSNPVKSANGVTTVTTTGTTGVLSVNLTGLTAGSTYSFKAYAINSRGTTYTTAATFTTEADAPTVTTPTSTSITSSTATLGGNVTYNGGANITERGVVYSSTDSDPIKGEEGVITSTTSGTNGVFTVPVTGLVSSTQYYFKAYAMNSEGTTYTAPVSTFTTLDAAPSITTPTKTDITTSGATVGGTVTADGGSEIIECGVVYSLTATNTNPALLGTGVLNVTTTPGTGLFTVGLTGLLPGRGYSFRAYATNSIGTTYTSPVSTFTTLVAEPTVVSPTKTAITAIAATLGGNVTGNGGGTVTERGVVYSLSTTNPNPLINGGGVTKKALVGAVGVFTIPVTSLEPGKAYSFKAYATNSAGTTYTTVSTFTTLDAAPTVTTPTKVVFSTTVAIIGGNVTKDGGADITERGVVYSLTGTNNNPQIGKVGVTKETRIGTTGVFTVLIEGLAPGQLYSFRAYATNTKGTTYTTVTTFKMQSAAPTVTGPTKSLLTAKSFTLRGNVTKDNGARITERGVVYSSSNEIPVINGQDVTKKVNIGTLGVFNVPLFGLDPATEYFCRAYATNSVGTTYTDVLSVTTLVAQPTVTTPTQTSITTTKAKLGGNVTKDGGDTITQRGVVYSKTSANSNPKIGGAGVKKAVSIGTTGVFTVNLTGLDPGVKYTFKAYATNSAGTTYTSKDTFTTASSMELVGGIAAGLSDNSIADTWNTINTIDPASGAKYLTIAITKAPGTEQQLRIVEVSSNLTDWFSGSNHTTVLSDDAGVLKVRDNTPITPGTKRYIRLKPSR